MGLDHNAPVHPDYEFKWKNANHSETIIFRSGQSREHQRCIVYVKDSSLIEGRFLILSNHIPMSYNFLTKNYDWKLTNCKGKKLSNTFFPPREHTYSCTHASTPDSFFSLSLSLAPPQFAKVTPEASIVSLQQWRANLCLHSCRGVAKEPSNSTHTNDTLHDGDNAIDPDVSS